MVFSLPTLAEDEPLADIQGSAANRQEHNRSFELAAESELALTVACKPNMEGTPQFRMMLLRVNDDDSTTELERYRIVRAAEQRRVSADITLPAGRYQLVIVAIRMDYRVKLDHVED